MITDISSAICSAFQSLQSLWPSSNEPSQTFTHRPGRHGIQVRTFGLPHLVVMMLALQTAAAAETTHVKHILMLDFKLDHVSGSEVAAVISKAFPELEVRKFPVKAMTPQGDEIKPYEYLRNLLAPGRDKMVSIAPGALRGNPKFARTLATSLALQDYLRANGIEHVALPFWVSLANMHYDHELDLLIIAHAEGIQPRCASPRFLLHSSCGELTEAVYTAFGRPENVLQLVANFDTLQRNGKPECYDLDMYFHLATNQAGEKVALVYKPCLEARPQSSLMARDTVLERLDDLGIAIIELSRDDFKRLAANGISPERGKILFPAEVSYSLTLQLAAHGIQTLYPRRSLGHAGDGRLDVFGLHCVTADVVQTRGSDSAPERHAEL